MGRVLNRALAWNGPLVTLMGLMAALFAGLMLVQLTPLGGVLFVVLVVVGVATVIEPLAGLTAALFLGPLRAYLSAEVPQIPAQIAQVFVALTLAVWLARGLARRNLVIPHPPLLLPLAIFCGAALLSLWDAVELPVYGVPELIKWVQILLLFLFVSQTLTRQRLPWLLGALLVTGLFQAGVGIWQFGLRGDGPDHFGILGGDFYRAYGTFEQPNPYAGYIGMTLVLAVGVTIGAFDTLWDKGKRQLVNIREAASPYHIALLITVVALAAALAMSWSRGAWMGFGAAALVMAIALPRKTHWGILLVAVLIVGGLGLYTTGLLPTSIMARLTDFAQYVSFEDVRGVGINDANYAVIERMAHWQAALEMLRHDLWTGVGIGCYEPAYARFALINWPIALGHAHNYYLNMAAETGLFGLAAYVFLWAAVFWQTWQVTRRAEGLLRGIAIGLLGTWTHLSVHHLFDNLYVNNVHLHVGVWLGILAFIVQRMRTADSANRRRCEDNNG
ncbi:MAG: O-antigen ligase family protein [Chloroflexi bacterium]|nr:O-antigen ligase family protein [Chloroflexota bacterium]